MTMSPKSVSRWRRVRDGGNGGRQAVGVVNESQIGRAGIDTAEGLDRILLGDVHEQIRAARRQPWNGRREQPADGGREGDHAQCAARRAVRDRSRRFGAALQRLEDVRRRVDDGLPGKKASLDRTCRLRHGRAMTDLRKPAEQLFGSNLVAMVTPMCPDGTLSEPGLADLIDHLLATGCDGIVVGGTTGESPTVTDAEAVRLVQAVAYRSDNRAQVVAGVGTYDTAVSIRRAREAEAAGADALLLVCPYYSRPTQAGVVAHCVAVADATELPVMLYDVPRAPASRWRRPR